MSKVNKSFLKFLTDFGPLIIFFYYYYDSGKDLKIAIQEAEKQGASLEITKLIDSFYDDIQKMGGSRWDTSSLLKRLQHND